MTRGTAPTDEVLARDALQDAAAFTELYRRYVQRVYAYQLARTGSVELAQDLTSQTFLSALESLPSFRGEGCFAAWLMTIAHNKMAGYYRGRREEIPLSIIEDLPASLLSPEEAVDHRLRLSQITQSLKKLAPDRAEAILLRAIAGLSINETAAVMKKTDASVKMLVLRGLQDLRSLLVKTSALLEEEK